MQTEIGKFDPATGQVPVRFSDGDWSHARPVNAVLTKAGKYDRTATAARVADVAQGVAHKRALGLLQPED